MKKGMSFSVFFILIIFFLIFISIVFFTQKNYKSKIYGNNKDVDKIEQIVKPFSSKMIVKQPDSISNMELIYENGTLEIKNTELNVSKVYHDYPYLSNNMLFLTDYIKTYGESVSKSIEEYEDAIYVKIEKEDNIYNKKQILRINKQNLKPESMEIQNINNQTKIYILYNDIELNI